MIATQNYIEKRPCARRKYGGKRYLQVMRKRVFDRVNKSLGKNQKEESKHRQKMSNKDDSIREYVVAWTDIAPAQYQMVLLYPKAYSQYCARGT